MEELKSDNLEDVLALHVDRLNWLVNSKNVVIKYYSPYAPVWNFVNSIQDIDTLMNSNDEV